VLPLLFFILPINQNRGCGGKPLFPKEAKIDSLLKLFIQTKMFLVVNE
jgi:hypothetical protein